MPDGHIAFLATRNGRIELRQKLADGAATEESINIGDNAGVLGAAPTGWSADGRLLAFMDTSRVGTGSDIWVLPMTGDRKPFPVVQTPAIETNGVLSPDGRWIAYQSTEIGTSQFYVQPVPTTGAKYQISGDSGAYPLWRRDGKEIFFMTFNGRDDCGDD